MKIHRILCLGAAFLIPQLSPAELPVSHESLGQLESMLDFCSQVDAKSAPKYKEKGKAVVGDASEKDLAKARKSDEYKKAYDWVSGELRNVPKDDVAKACSDFLEDK